MKRETPYRLAGRVKAPEVPCSGIEKRRALRVRLQAGQTLEAAAFVLAERKKLKVQIELPDTLVVEYSVRDHLLVELEEALIAAGFTLDDTLAARVQRAWYHYCEAVQREHLEQPERLLKQAQTAFVQEYQEHPHGDHDPAPEELRHYH
ncbi:hypothetical protein [Hydrogenophilus hirschii]